MQLQSPRDCPLPTSRTNLAGADRNLQSARSPYQTGTHLAIGSKLLTRPLRSIRLRCTYYRGSKDEADVTRYELTRRKALRLLGGAGAAAAFAPRLIALGGEG